MDLTATLTAAEIETLSDYKSQTLDGAQNERADVCEDAYLSEDDFQHSLRLKNTLDVLEGNSAAAPTNRDLAVTINSEYQLWLTNAHTPLKQNPFLSHWVEALERLGWPDIQGVDVRSALGNISKDTMKMVRVLLIRALLLGKNASDWASYSPAMVALELLSERPDPSFDLQTYVRMLEDEGIYEKTPEPEASAAPITRDHNSNAHTPAGTELSPEEALQKQKEDILRELKEEPQTAIFDITRLPITLTHLDFLTTILTDRTLEKHSIDPAPVITQYIQHALRTVERMDKPPSPSSEVATEQVRSNGEVLEYGKEAQGRCILLLLLFIKSLIRKQVVELDVLFYEIAEITVRYVWIKEVRDFRTWVEEGREVGGDVGG